MASAAQAERYRQLLRLVDLGTIENLRTEVSYPLTVNNRLICKYRADFTYDVCGGGGRVLRSIVEDVKGMATPDFLLKQKLFDALQPVRLTVIHVSGKAKQVDCDGVMREGSAGWVARHWHDRLPD